MLERNRLQPPRPSEPSPTAGWTDAPAGAGGMFASAEDYDATGILAGVDPCESRYWWMPELFGTAGVAGPISAVDVDAGGAAETVGGSQRRSELAERLRHPGQAARRAAAPSTAAA